MSLQGAFAALVRGLSPTPLTCAVASADVLVVDASGGGGSTTLPAAVDAAAAGDALLVRTGSYAGFLPTGKGLSLVAEPGAAVAVAADLRLLSITGLGTAPVVDVGACERP